MKSNIFLENIIDVWKYLPPKRRYQLYFLVFLIIITSIAEIFSIGAVIPFLSALTNPHSVMSSGVFESVVQRVGIINASQLPLIFGSFFCICVLGAGLLRYLLLVAQTKITYGIGVDFSIEIFKRSLYQPYLVHISRNSSEIITGVSNKSNELIVSLLYPLAVMLSSCVMLLGVFITLMYISAQITLITAAFFIFFYGVVFYLSKKILSDSSKIISKEYQNVIKIIQEGLGGIRDILLDGTQKIFIDNYQASETSLRNARANLQIVSGAPRYIIETAGTIFIIILALRMVANDGGVDNIVPVLGVVVLASQRLMPLAQQLYSSWAAIRGGSSSVADALTLLAQPIDEYVFNTKNQKVNSLFLTEVCLKDISFSYGLHAPLVLKEVNLRILKGARIGIIGVTGSGKSTLLDILMGLITPTHGQIYIDGLRLTKDMIRDWQQSIAHVPQSIYLSDTSFEENIAFGCSKDNIEYEKLVAASKVAQIHDFILSQPYGYKTRVGEMGVSLSGGQRQRLGIARAIYKEASVIILDEGTSALDSDTEAAIMEAIYAMPSKITLIIVAHRHSTLHKCDILYRVNKGSLVRINRELI